MSNDERLFLKKMYKLCQIYYSSIKSNHPDCSFTHYSHYYKLGNDDMLMVYISYDKNYNYLISQKFQPSRLKSVLYCAKNNTHRLSLHQFYKCVQRNNIEENLISEIQLNLISEI